MSTSAEGEPRPPLNTDERAQLISRARASARLALGLPATAITPVASSERLLELGASLVTWKRD